MSSKRFWDETPADGEPETGHGPQSPKEFPVAPGGESAIDPDTGEWKPKKVLREWEAKGYPIREVIGPIMQMNFTDDTGRDVTVNVPFDPADGEPDIDALEVDTLQWASDLEAIKAGVKDHELERVLGYIHMTVGDYRATSDTMIEAVAEALGSIKVTLSGDDDNLTPDQITALETEIGRLLIGRGPEILRAIADTPNPDNRGDTFWEAMARDAIAHAYLYARDDVMQEMGYSRADLEALANDDYETFETRVQDRYIEAPYLSVHLIHATNPWVGVLAQIAAQSLEALSTGIEDAPEGFVRLIERARENLGLPAADDGTPMPQLHGDPLPKNQAGLIQLTSLGAHQEAVKALARFPTWEPKVPGGNPEHQMQGRNTNGHLYIEGGSAMRLWQELQAKSVKARTRAHSDILPDVLIAVLAIGSARRGQLDLFGNGTAYMPIEWLAKTVGITGKRKPADIDKLYAGLRVIGDIQMTGRRVAWISGKKTEIPFIGPMWQIMETVPKVNTREEYDRFLKDGPQIVPKSEYSTPIPPLDIAGVSLAIGAGLIATVDENPQFAQVVAKLTDYSPVHGRYKRWLGFVLSWIFRDRKKQQSWKQAFTVRWLLQEAGLPVDEKPVNPQRPFTLFQEALETLQADGVIGEYQYPDEKGGVFKRGGRGWYPRWLDSCLVIMPPDDVHAAYLESNRKALARSRKRQTKKAG